MHMILTYHSELHIITQRFWLIGILDCSTNILYVWLICSDPISQKQETLLPVAKKNKERYFNGAEKKANVLKLFYRVSNVNICISNISVKIRIWTIYLYKKNSELTLLLLCIIFNLKNIQGVPKLGSKISRAYS